MGDDNRDNRPAALLTNAQREYLRGEKEYRPSTERDVRSRIRERIMAGLSDYQLVFDEIEERDRDKLLAEWEDHWYRREVLWDSMVGTLAFLYEISDVLEWEFEDLVKTAIEDAYRTHRRSASVSVTADIDVDTRTIASRWFHRAAEAAKNKYDREGIQALTSGDILALIESGDADAQSIIREYQEAKLKKQRDRADDQALERANRKAKAVDYSNVSEEEFNEYRLDEYGEK